jgi:hypothetical protein
MKKRRNLIVAAITVVALGATLLIGCKKEDADAGLNQKTPTKEFAPPQVDDMNAYLKDFKQKMQAATRDGEETLTLEEAAWHLSSLANYEFANANVECNAVRFDTLYAQVNITNGSVLLSDLGLAYEDISASIGDFYNSLALNNKHFRFINAFISENGEVTVPILTTYIKDSKDLPDHTWYYLDDWTLIYACDSLLPEDDYAIQTEGTPALQSALNLVVSHPTISNGIGIPPQGSYYTLASSTQFPYNQYTDPYGSPFNNSRLFNSYNTTNVEVNGYHMCYLLDSYLGLGNDNCPTYQVIASWDVAYTFRNLNGDRSVEYHTLTVNYATEHNILNPEPGIGGD